MIHITLDTDADSRKSPSIGSCSRRRETLLQMRGIERAAEIPLGQQGRRNFDPIAPSSLRLIQSCIRLTDQGSETWLGLLCFEPRDSETRCGHHVAAVEGELSRFEFRTNAFRGSFDVISGSMSYNDQKFFAAKPSTQIAASRMCLQNVGKFFQNFIAGIVSERVVDVLKAVQIGNNHP